MILVVDKYSGIHSVYRGHLGVKYRYFYKHVGQWLMDFENLNAILKKTDKGVDALKVRDPSLPQKSRVLLILIDGKKTLAELTPLLTVGSDSHERIKELLNSGFVVEITQHQTRTSENLTTQHIVADSKAKLIDSTQSLQVAVRAATKMLSAMLGPNADVLCMQLEKCNTKDEYNTKILAFRKIIGTMRTEKHGDEFVKAAIL